MQSRVRSALAEGAWKTAGLLPGRILRVSSCVIHLSSKALYRGKNVGTTIEEADLPVPVLKAIAEAGTSGRTIRLP